jgi:hypothetical protein
MEPSDVLGTGILHTSSPNVPPNASALTAHAVLFHAVVVVPCCSRVAGRLGRYGDLYLPAGTIVSAMPVVNDNMFNHPRRVGESERTVSPVISYL